MEDARSSCPIHHSSAPARLLVCAGRDFQWEVNRTTRRHAHEQQRRPGQFLKTRTPLVFSRVSLHLLFPGGIGFEFVGATGVDIDHGAVMSGSWTVGWVL